MTKAQNLFYFSLFGQARKKEPTLDRKELHARHGLPESHKDFTEGQFDEWKAICLAIAEPTNYEAQVGQASMPSTRKRWYIRQLLDALEEPEEYAGVILARMRKARKQRWTGAGDLVTLETADTDALHYIVVALKQRCRRAWDTKDALLGEIAILWETVDFDEAAASEAVRETLSVEKTPRLEELVYESLLLVLGTLRRLAAGRPARVVEESNVPF